MTTREETMNNGRTRLLEESDDGLVLDAEDVDRMDHAAMVRLKGYVDFFNATRFTRNLRELRAAGVDRVLMDMTGLTFLASAGVGAIIAFEKELKQDGGALVLFGIQPKVMDVLSLLGFASFLTILDTEDAAHRHLSTVKYVPVFPTVRRCPICHKNLRLTREGRFRCPECHVILNVTRAAEFVLG